MKGLNEEVIRAFVEKHPESVSVIEGSILEAVREKCPNTEFFLVCIFPHSD